MKRLKAAIKAFLEPDVIKCKHVFLARELEKNENSSMLVVNKIGGHLEKGDIICVNGYQCIVINAIIEVAIKT